MLHHSHRVSSVLPTASLLVSDIFSGPYLLNVPVYQRPYSWRWEEAGQLLEDLCEAAGLDAAQEADESYFLSTILLMDSPGTTTEKLSPKMSPREFDIVDGQQRLVTLMTLFAVLRDLENNVKSPLSKRVQGMILAQQGSRFFPKVRFRLQLASRDRAYFERYILQPGSTLETPSIDDNPQTFESALSGVRVRFIEELKGLSADDRVRLFTYVADRCHMVTIVSHDIDGAYRSFVRLNERGMRLQRNDILKADVLSQLPLDKIAWAADLWDHTSDRLGVDFDGFFSHVRAIYGQTRPQIVTGVRAVVSDQGGPENFLTKAFLPLAGAYAAIRNESGSLPPELGRYLTYLNRMPDGDWAPAAMLALRDWQDDVEGATRHLSQIDRLAHLLRLLCLGNNKRVRRLGVVVDALRKEGALPQDHPAFQLTREEVRNIGFHLKDLHRRNPKVCKLLLLRLSDEISGTVANVDPQDYTIEHVLPQNFSATSEWRRWIPVAEERNACTESIGNLVLISQKQNDKARNGAFASKKAVYAQTDPKVPLLAITRDVLYAAEWRRFDIEAREERLQALLQKIWRIDFSQGKPSGRGAGAQASSEVTEKPRTT